MVTLLVHQVWFFKSLQLPFFVYLEARLDCVKYLTVILVVSVGLDRGAGEADLIYILKWAKNIEKSLAI